MTYYYGNQFASFEKDAVMQHRSGGKILLRDGFVGEAAYRQALASKAPAGREADLTCESLSIQFSQTAGGGGAGRLSGYELAEFSANNKVLFEDSNVRVIAQQISYNSNTGLLDVRGTEAANAEIYDRRSSSAFASFKGPYFTYNMKTGHVEAGKSAFIGR
jgi:hypothetical protein